MGRTKKFSALLETYEQMDAAGIAGRMARVSGLDAADIPWELCDPMTAANWETYLEFRSNVFRAVAEPEQCSLWLDMLTHSTRPADELRECIANGSKSVWLRYPEADSIELSIARHTSRRDRQQSPGSTTIRRYAGDVEIHERAKS